MNTYIKIKNRIIKQVLLGVGTRGGGWMEEVNKGDYGQWTLYTYMKQKNESCWNLFKKGIGGWRENDGDESNQDTL
jgi:hypothetical protein